MLLIIRCCIIPCVTIVLSAIEFRASDVGWVDRHKNQPAFGPRHLGLPRMPGWKVRQYCRNVMASGAHARGFSLNSRCGVAGELQAFSGREGRGCDEFEVGDLVCRDGGGVACRRGCTL